MALRFPRAALATMQLGRPVEEFIAERRANDVSYQRIADDLRDATDGGTCVTDMTVRAWYLAAQSDAEATA